MKLPYPALVNSLKVKTSKKKLNLARGKTIMFRHIFTRVAILSLSGTPDYLVIIMPQNFES